MITVSEAVALRALIAGRTYSKAAAISGLEVWQIRSLALRAGHPSIDRMVAALTEAGHEVSPQHVSENTPRARTMEELVMVCTALDTARSRQLERRLDDVLKAMEAEIAAHRAKRTAKARAEDRIRRAELRVERAEERLATVQAEQRDAATVRAARKSVELRRAELQAAKERARG